MKVTKRVIDILEMVYAVSPIELDGEVHFVAATETHGKCRLFSSPCWKSSTVWDGPGGTVSIAPMPGQRSFLAVQEFFPVFQSEQAGIVLAEAGRDISAPWKVRRVLDLPFVHRIEVVKAKGTLFLVAATLCGARAFRDDWSSPGAVYACRIPEGSSGIWKLEAVLPGISKNHGMRATVINGQNVVLIAGQQGMFALHIPAEPNGGWKNECLIDHAVSDVYDADIDGDGIAELVTIEPFHGDRLIVYKFLSGSWRPIFETAINFGHVVWAGSILGMPGVIVGSRGGDKDMVWLRMKSGAPFTMEGHVLDRGVAPAQIAVVPGKDSCLIVSANHGAGEVALYEVSLF